MNIASARILIEVTGWQRFTVNGYRPRDEDVYVSYGLPGRQVARFPMRDDQTMFLFVFADAKGRCLEQPELIIKTFCGPSSAKRDRRQQKNVSVHHVASLMDKEHVRVQCLGNKVALADHTRVLSVRRFLFPELTRS